MQRIDNLTGIRGFAALWVALYHFQMTTGVESLSFGELIGRGTWGVDVFFVLSGLILAITYAPGFAREPMSRASFGRFLWKRLARIYPLHIVTFLVMFCAWAVASHQHYQFASNSLNNSWTALCNVLLVHAWGLTREGSWNTPSWSISAEWFAYLLIFPVCITVLEKRSLRFCLGLTLALWLAFMAWVDLTQGGHISRVTTTGALRIIPEFIAGYTCFRIVQSGVRVSRGDVVTVLGLAWLVTIAFLPDIASCLLLLPAVMLLMLGLYAGGTLTDRIFGNRVSVFLGEISYSIYMLHIFVVIAANQLTRRLHIHSPMNARSIVAAEIIVTIAASYLAYVLIESPARAALTRERDVFTRLDTHRPAA